MGRASNVRIIAGTDQVLKLVAAGDVKAIDSISIFTFLSAYAYETLGVDVINLYPSFGKRLLQAVQDLAARGVGTTKIIEDYARVSLMEVDEVASKMLTLILDDPRNIDFEKVGDVLTQSLPKRKVY